MGAEEESSPDSFTPSELDMWKLLEREALDFRFVQEPVFNLSEAEEAILERLRGQGLDFGVLPRQDPTSFLGIRARLEGMAQRVEIGVDKNYVSFITRRTPFAEKLLSRMEAIFGPQHLDRSRAVTTRTYVWFAFFLEEPPRLELPRERRKSSLFNFDDRERLFLDALECAVHELNPELDHPAHIHVYPRETSFGGIDLLVSDGQHSQSARVFVKGLYPTVYRFITENTPLGQRVRTYFDRALGRENLDPAASRTEGRFLTLIYQLRSQPGCSS